MRRMQLWHTNIYNTEEAFFFLISPVQRKNNMLPTFSELYWDLQSPAGFLFQHPCCIHWIVEEGCTCAQKNIQDFNWHSGLTGFHFSLYKSANLQYSKTKTASWQKMWKCCTDTRPSYQCSLLYHIYKHNRTFLYQIVGKCRNKTFCRDDPILCNY